MSCPQNENLSQFTLGRGSAASTRPRASRHVAPWSWNLGLEETLKNECSPPPHFQVGKLSPREVQPLAQAWGLAGGLL